MTLTDDQITTLRSYRNESYEDDVRYKEIIKNKLVDSELIIYLLNNTELEDEGAEASDYFGVNILPYYMVTPTQTNVQNFICFETNFSDVSRSNSIMKKQEIIFYILCEQKNIIENYTSAARHDLIASILIEMFQGINDFGNQMKLLSNQSSVVDNDYACRTLVFEQITTSSMGKIAGGLRRGY